jgi:transposase
MAKETAPNRQYTDEFKLEALRLGESAGINEAAKRLGIPGSSLSNWVRLKRQGKLSALPRNRLWRELANAKLDLEIVKKAAAYFAKESR